MRPDKRQVHDYWNDASCGEGLYLPSVDADGYQAQAKARYELEPEILELGRFDEANGKRVLEIGVGLGADHQRYAEAGADLYGIDLTERAVSHTKRRLEIFGLTSQLSVGDAERLGFPDACFDLVFSWGVLHHSPNTRKAVSEVYRVLKPGGEARVMIYHKWSMVGLMLWLRYSLLRGRIVPLSHIYARYLESPGTKAYTVTEAHGLFEMFGAVRIETRLSAADLLESDAGQRHRGWLLAFARRIWPRSILKRCCPKVGLEMIIEAWKQQQPAAR